MLELLERPAEYLLEEFDSVFRTTVPPLAVDAKHFSLSVRQIGGWQWAVVDIIPTGWNRSAKLETRFENNGEDWAAKIAQVITIGTHCPACGKSLAGRFSYLKPEAFGEPWRLHPEAHGFCCPFLRELCFRHYHEASG